MATQLRRGILAAPVLLLLAGCGSKQNALDAHSSAAGGIDSLWWKMLAGSVLGFGIVAVILFLAWVRRNRPGSDRAALPVVVGLGLVVPIVVLSVLFAAGDIFLIRKTSPPAANAASTELTVRVAAHQYWWEVRYPGTRAVTANEIHIPARTNVVVLVHSDDVIHSFWVPELNRKIDVLPDQVNRVELYADQPGRYRGQCAEFCGLQHAHMGIYVFAEPQAAFRSWLARQAQPSASTSQLFDTKCGSCHAIRGTGATGTAGPDLTHVASRTSLAALTIPNTRNRLTEWIRDPQRVKPGSLMPKIPLTPAQIAALVRYLEARR